MPLWANLLPNIAESTAMRIAGIVQPKRSLPIDEEERRDRFRVVPESRFGPRPQVSEKHWFLKNCRLLSRLPEAELQELERHSRSGRFGAGETIYVPIDRADAVLILVSGQVKLCHVTPDGKESILAFIEPGELFGEMSLVGANSREELAIATRPSTIVIVPRSAIEAMMNQHAQLALGVTQLLGFRRMRIERRLKAMLFRSSRDRLVQLLLELAQEHGSSTADGVEIRLKLSHQDLANIIGSTRETVTNSLGQLQLEGLVLLGRQRVTVCSIERLTKVADEGSQAPQEE